jgi:hypothetical protein
MAEMDDIEIGCLEEEVLLAEVSISDEAKAPEEQVDTQITADTAEEMVCEGSSACSTSVEKCTSETYDEERLSKECVVCRQEGDEFLSLISRGMSTFMDNCTHAGRLDIVQHVNKYSDA